MIALQTQNKNTDFLTVNPINQRIIDCHLEGLDQSQIVAFIVGISERDKNAIVVDAGAMASGKTQIAAGVTKVMLHESFVAIAHRVSLIHGLSKTLNLTHYKDVTPQEYLKNLAVCVNSIKKLAVAERFKNAVFDEFRQTLETVLMANTIENRKEIISEFNALLNNAEFSMCLDADFNEFCLDYLLENTDKNIYRIHRHVEPHNKQIIERKNHNAIRKECVQNYLDGLNSMIAVSSIKESQRCRQYFGERNIKHTEVLDITGDNKKDPRIKAFYLNPEEEIKNYRILIYTPAITSGVSIVEPYFDRHYALFGKVLQSNENLQMVARDRTAQTVYCSFAKDNGKKLPIDIDKLIHGSIKQRLRLELTKNNTIKSSEIQLDPIEVLQLKLQVQFNDDLNNYRVNFFNHALKNGYKVKSYDPNQPSEADDVLQKGLNKRTLAHHVQIIKNSPLIDAIQAAILDKASETTQDETNALHRYKTTQMAGITEIVDQDIENYLKGDFKVVLRHESLEANQYKLIEKDRISWQENGKFVSNSGLAYIANKVITLLDGKVIDNALAFEAYDILVEHSDELVANGFTNYAGKEIARPLRTVKNFLNKFGYTTSFLQQRGTIDRERVFELIKTPHIEQYVNQRQTQKLQALAIMHTNDILSSKEIKIVSVHFENYGGLDDEIKGFVLPIHSEYKNVELAT
jgi:hypothetical protein